MRRSTTPLWIFVFALAVGCGGAGSSESGPGTTGPTGDRRDESFRQQLNVEEGSPTAEAVLKLVNKANIHVLDDKVDLDSRAAENIYQHRIGPDGEPNTKDDDPYGSLAELDSVAYVGPNAFKKLKKYAEQKGSIDELNAVHGIVPGSDEAKGLIAVANTASRRTLDHDVRLDARGASNLIEHRIGPDQTAGTQDDNPYDTLNELDNVSYIAATAFKKLEKYGERYGFIQSQNVGTVHGFDDTGKGGLGILRIANLAPESVLDDDIGLDSRAATNIVEYRVGEDGEPDTGDENPFDDLIEFDEINYVSDRAFGKLAEYGRAHGFLPPKNRSSERFDYCPPSKPHPHQLKGCRILKRGTGDLVIRGDVLREDGVLRRGEITIETSKGDGKLSCVGCHCTKSSQSPTIVSCPGKAISPGLINSHDHLGWATVGPADGMKGQYSHRNEWRRGKNGMEAIDNPSSDYTRTATLHGELRHLLGGTTSIAGSSRSNSDGGLVRNLDSDSTGKNVDAQVEYTTFPLGDIGGTMLKDGCDYGRMSKGTVLGHESWMPHIGEGIDKAANNEFQCLSKMKGKGKDLVESNITVTHGIGMKASDIREIAAEGGALGWSPRTNLALYGDTADVVTYRRYGVPITLGTDWPITGSTNLLRELSCAKKFSENHLNDRLSAKALWKMATVNGAVALNVDNLGRLKAGYVADVAMFDGSFENPYRGVIDADTDDVRLVLRNGHPVFGDERLVRAATTNWPERGRAKATEGCTQVSPCDQPRLVCAARDSKRGGSARSYEKLKSALNKDSYPLFVCDSDELEEPACAPRQPDPQGGNDRDGDGVADADDSCPTLFNPTRPMAGGQQLDGDGDGDGDPCDPCPTMASNTCQKQGMDGDGVTRAKDNCPWKNNPQQTDGDSDGRGDACDHSASVYAAHDGRVTPPSKITVDEAVVSAAGGGVFFAQVPADAKRFQGLKGSGLPVPFKGDLPDRGDVVTVRGRLTVEHGLKVLGFVEEFTVHQNESATIPAPTVIDPCAVPTGKSATSSDLIGTLVEVQNVTVTNANPDGPKNDYGEFAVGSCQNRPPLRVDDQLHAAKPDPKKGDQFTRIRGILHYSFGHPKILPRSASSLQRK
ncbi:MAG: amidohydrolase family protein [Bradymonadaceae bacterium]